MDQGVVNFIRDKQIDSFPKLRFLLFLRQNPQIKGNTQNLAEKLYIEAPLVERLIHDLLKVGLLEAEQGSNNSHYLNLVPASKMWLEKLAVEFNHPVARQELLAQIKKPIETVNQPGSRVDTSHSESWKLPSPKGLFVQVK